MDIQEPTQSAFIAIESFFTESADTLNKVCPLDELLAMSKGGIALESVVGESYAQTLSLDVISVEGIRETVVALYQRFIDLLVKGWDYLVTYLDTVYVQVTQLLSRADELTDLAKERTQSHAKAAVVNVDTSIGSLTYNYKALEPKEFIGHISQLPNVLDTVLLDHVNRVINASKYISPLVESLMAIDVTDPESLDDVRHDARAIAKFGNEVHEGFVAYRGENVTGSRTELLNGNVVTQVKRVEALLGNKSIYVKYGSVDKAALRGEGIPFFNAITTVFGSGMVLSATDPEKTLPNDTTLKTLTPDEVIRVCEGLEDALKVIRRFKVRYDNDLKTQRKRYQRLRGKLSVMSREGDNAEANLYLRRIGSAAIGLSRWYYDPFIPLISHSLKVTRSSLLYCSRSLAQWPVK